MEHLVTVIIPTYNMCSTLAACINSVLNQSYSNLEIIIVDDASTDDTAGVMEDYTANAKITYIKKDKNESKINAVADGLDRANGEFITIVDADDTLPPQSIKLRVNALNNTGKSAVYGAAEYIASHGKRFRKSRLVQTEQEVINYITVPFVGATAMFKKEAITGSQISDKQYPRSEDTLFNLLLFRSGVTIIDDCVYNYTLHHRTASQRLKYRVQSARDLCNIIYNEYHGPSKYQIMAKQAMMQTAKAVWEIFSDRK